MVIEDMKNYWNYTYIQLYTSEIKVKHLEEEVTPAGLTFEPAYCLVIS